MFPFAPVGPFEDYVKGVEDGSLPNAFTIHCCLTSPASRGEIRLRPTPNARHALPEIRQNYLTAPSDVTRLVEAVKQARVLAQRPELDGVRGEELLPGVGVQTDAELEAYVRASACHFFGNLVGTCRMGEVEGDAGAVVDPECRVRGVAGLRVVDASVIPRLMCGQPNAIVGAVAERKPEGVAREWRGRRWGGGEGRGVGERAASICEV